MVVSGLGLLLGSRADAGGVRAGSERALVEGRLRIDADGANPADAVAARALEQLDELGAEVEDGTILLARAVSSEGRSRAWLGGRAIPIAALADFTTPLVAVHGQSDQVRLLAPSRQLDALDRYIGPAALEPRADYAAGYERMRAVQGELDELASSSRERIQEADLLRFGLAEIEAVAPESGEDAALDVESRRLGAADALRLAAQLAHAALAGDVEDPASDQSPDVLQLIGSAQRALAAVRNDDDAAAALGDRLADLASAAADLAAELGAYAGGLDADPARLAVVEDRRAALRALTRKYGAGADDVLDWAVRARERLAELDPDDTRGEGLEAERLALLAHLAELARGLSEVRTEGAAALGKAVTAELSDLAMPNAEVVVTVSRTDAADGLIVDGRAVGFGPTGCDTVEILLTPHAGAPLRPLAKGASGGELSRVMLAVEVVFAGSDPAPTFVFDEVDAGVGGKAAVEVGRRLARLSASAQVLVVTHLPQVAAFADRHLVVEKASDGAVVASGVCALDHDGRIAELTRMLAGLEGSQSGRAHAEELLAIAAEVKGR